MKLLDQYNFSKSLKIKPHCARFAEFVSDYAVLTSQKTVLFRNLIILKTGVCQKYFTVMYIFI